jgi:hypothetical protein
MGMAWFKYEANSVILQHPVLHHCDTQAAQEQWSITDEYTSVHMGLQE